MLLWGSRLWVVITLVLYSSKSHTESICSPHVIEDVRQYSTQVTVETISFNELIKQLLSLVQSAELSHFSIVKDNFILARSHICLGSGTGLQLGTVKWLQEYKFSGKHLLSIRWVNSQLLVFDNHSSNALFLNADEIQGLLSNYHLTNIQEAENSNLFLEGTTVNLFRPENYYICQASKLLLQNGLAFDNLIEKIYDKIRLIFELNSLLINVVDPLLHK